MSGPHFGENSDFQESDRRDDAARQAGNEVEVSGSSRAVDRGRSNSDETSPQVLRPRPIERAGASPVPTVVVATQGSRMVTVPTAWFWGVAGLLVVLILMVVSLLVMVVSRGSDGPAQPVVAGESPSPSSSPSPSPSPSVELQTPEPETPMPSAEPSPSTAASASGPTVPPATEVSVQYQGPFVLDSYYKDLDLVPPARRSLTAGGELWYGRYKGFNADEDASIAVWNERSVPTYEDCRHVATAAGIETVDTHDLEEGQTVCVLTDEGRIARLKLVNKGFDEWGFDATVWDN